MLTESFAHVSSTEIVGPCFEKLVFSHHGIRLQDYISTFLGGFCCDVRYPQSMENL